MKRTSSVWLLTESYFTIQLLVLGYLATTIFGMHVSIRKFDDFREEMLTL